MGNAWTVDARSPAFLFTLAALTIYGWALALREHRPLDSAAPPAPAASSAPAVARAKPATAAPFAPAVRSAPKDATRDATKYATKNATRNAARAASESRPRAAPSPASELETLVERANARAGSEAFSLVKSASGERLTINANFLLIIDRKRARVSAKAASAANKILEAFAPPEDAASVVRAGPEVPASQVAALKSYLNRFGRKASSVQGEPGEFAVVLTKGEP